jgi:hypothetical protein
MMEVFELTAVGNGEPFSVRRLQVPAMDTVGLVASFALQAVAEMTAAARIGMKSRM